ncbi:MAG TPA: DUF6152 family protein [Gammaproteobacteria bacterium]
MTIGPLPPMLRFSAAAASLLLALAPASAHHSVAYYGDEYVELAGRIVEVNWRNPHVGMTLEVVNDRGITETWGMEGNSIYNLRRQGVTPDLFPAGQEVIVRGQMSTREDRMLLMDTIYMPDGREFILWDLTGRVAVDETVVDAAAENRGIFRVWSVPRANILAYLDQLVDQPFTERAIASRADWNPLDNYATRCEQEGMPRIMVNPHPFEFIDRGATITLRTELYDIERTIHMDRDAPSADTPWTPHGYSVGRWDGEDLVVTTTRVNWPYFDNHGTRQTEDVMIQERFGLSEDQSRLNFTVTVTDPETFSEPAVLSGYWEALGESIPSYDCQPLIQ